VSEKVRDRQRDRQRQTDREKGRETDRQTDREGQALVIGCRAAVYHRGLTEELGIKQEEPTPVDEDNHITGTMATGPIGKSQQMRQRNQLINYVRFLEQEKAVRIRIVASENQAADGLTKPMGPTQLWRRAPAMMGYSDAVAAIQRRVRIKYSKRGAANQNSSSNSSSGSSADETNGAEDETGRPITKQARRDEDQCRSRMGMDADEDRWHTDDRASTRTNTVTRSALTARIQMNNELLREEDMSETEYREEIARGERAVRAEANATTNSDATAGQLIRRAHTHGTKTLADGKHRGVTLKGIRSLMRNNNQHQPT
jgi:hypothetical protein